MKHLAAAIVLLAAAFITTVSAQTGAPVKAAGSYTLNGVTFNSPDQPDWKLARFEAAEILFEKEISGETVSAGVKFVKTNAFQNDKEALVGLEAVKEEDLKKLKRDSIHFYHTRFKSVSCVQYDGIFNPVAENPAAKFKYFNFRGYICPDPQSKTSAVQIEFSNLSNTRGLPQTLIDLGDEFINTLKFPKPAAKPDTSK